MALNDSPQVFFPLENTTLNCFHFLRIAAQKTLHTPLASSSTLSLNINKDSLSKLH